MTNWTQFRAKFPALEGKAYLNTAGGGVMSHQVAKAATQYFKESVEQGDICWNTWLARADRDRVDVGKFIGADSISVAFLQNASLGLNIVARSFESNIEVLAIKPEFPSCTTPFLRAGHTVTFMDTPASGYVDADMVKASLSESPKDVFVLSSVQFANGFRADLQAIGTVCQDLGALFIVDATQSIGAFGIDMVRDHIDVLVFSGYKWATAGYGNAVLATGNRWPQTSIPPLVGWRSAKQAYDLENFRLDMLPGGIGHEMGHPPFPCIFAIGEALRLLGQPKMTELESRITELTIQLREGLSALDLPIRSDGSANHLSGITLIELVNAGEIKFKLQERDVWVTARQGGLRISVHAYNNSADVEWLLRELELLVKP
jgi:cysteine desulfurase / selenocysteine lyase